MKNSEYSYIKNYHLIKVNMLLKKVEIVTIDNTIEILSLLKRLSKEYLLNIFINIDKV